MRTRKDGRDEVSAFFATLSDYIESSKKSQDIETIFGRLAMIVFAVALTTEVVTGNSLFRKMGLQGIAEVAGGVKDALRSVDLYLEQNNLHMGVEVIYSPKLLMFSVDCRSQQYINLPIG
ncbi:hypothetical protein LOK49_LG02G00843 [Camellia lanceoleosa]|uniref:Uncharacterized protein n=1 Tax=Camellia lanceoleosa TaxID=1840588 RepID=A0ACC0IQP7_9ERIC|nr:hypothetical protein LOK49_LG02G00843 [Camellia lanceoleosa]